MIDAVMNVLEGKNPWSELEQHHSSDGLLLRRSPCSELFSVFLGVDGYKHYLVLFRLPEEGFLLVKEKLPKIAGCNASFITIEDVVYFELVLLDRKNWRLFNLLIKELVLVLETSKIVLGNSKFIRLITETLKRCSLFFSRKKDPFTREKAIGLYGELYFILKEATPKVAWKKVVETWHGPLGHPQDFAIGAVAVEVKTTETGQPKMVRISSVEQLNPECEAGYLYVLSLSEAVTGEGMSLVSLVDAIRSFLVNEGGDLEDFELKLSLCGYTPVSKYSTQEYLVNGGVYYRLEDGFPRIAPSAISSGVENVRYSLNLNYCTDFITNPKWN